MANILGVDLGGTKLDYILTTDECDVIFQQRYPSPFRKTSRRLPGGEPEVLLDTVFTTVPISKRVSHYLAETESEFIKAAGKKRPFEKKGFSLGGKTWIHDGKIVMLGGNTPIRFATDLGNGKKGIVVAPSGGDIAAANDGQAAATAQGIYYQAKAGLDPSETGYFILGTGFGFGIPANPAPLEIGHIPAGFVPEILWQPCGCTAGRKTACMENYVSGRGIQNTAETLLALNGRSELKRIAGCLPEDELEKNLFERVAASRLNGLRGVDARAIMALAEERADGLAEYVASLAAAVSALAAVTAAQLFGLRRIGFGESVARLNPWHVQRIADRTRKYVDGSHLLKPPVVVELSPLKNPSKYGSLALVAPVEKYDVWTEKMKST